MHYVYILLSQKDSKKYIGSTSDINRRIEKHNLGKVKSTKNRTPLTLIHLEKYSTKTEALKREQYIKRLKGKLNFELNQIKDSEEMKYPQS